MHTNSAHSWGRGGDDGGPEGPGVETQRFFVPLKCSSSQNNSKEFSSLQ